MNRLPLFSVLVLSLSTLLGCVEAFEIPETPTFQTDATTELPSATVQPTSPADSKGSTRRATQLPTADPTPVEPTPRMTEAASQLDPTSRGEQERSRDAAVCGPELVTSDGTSAPYAEYYLDPTLHFADGSALEDAEPAYHSTPSWARSAPAANTTYGELNDFVASVYRNHFNRPPEPSALAYWTNEFVSNPGGPSTYSALEAAIVDGNQGDDTVAATDACGRRLGAATCEPTRSFDDGAPYAAYVEGTVYLNTEYGGATVDDLASVQFYASTLEPTSAEQRAVRGVTYAFLNDVINAAYRDAFARPVDRVALVAWTERFASGDVADLDALESAIHVSAQNGPQLEVDLALDSCGGTL